MNSEVFFSSLYSVICGKKLKFLFIAKQVCLTLFITVVSIFINWPPKSQDFFLPHET